MFECLLQLFLSDHFIVKENKRILLLLLQSDVSRRQILTIKVNPHCKIKYISSGCGPIT